MLFLPNLAQSLGDRRPTATVILVNLIYTITYIILVSLALPPSTASSYKHQTPAQNGPLAGRPWYWFLCQLTHFCVSKVSICDQRIDQIDCYAALGYISTSQCVSHEYWTLDGISIYLSSITLNRAITIFFSNLLVLECEFEMSQGFCQY